jgi:hypothetical protein
LIVRRAAQSLSFLREQFAAMPKLLFSAFDRRFLLADIVFSSSEHRRDHHVIVEMLCHGRRVLFGAARPKLKGGS